MKDILILIPCVFIVMACLALITLMEERVFQQAAQTECARFHPETGDFEWLDKQGEHE